MDLARFRKTPIMGILRSSVDIDVEGLVGSAISSGLEAIEVAMNSGSAGSLIARAVKAARGRLMVGAGTVLDIDTLDDAISSGATFIVTPVLIEDVVASCVKKGIPVFPGALTPLEVYRAWRSGASMVKVFPAGVLGPRYIKELKGPFGDIEIMACGGVTAGNIREYFNSGASAVAFGSSIFRKELLEKGDFAAIGRSIRGLIDNAR